MFFFGGYCVVYGVWTFSVGGWIEWIRLENRANNDCERLGSDIHFYHQFSGYYVRYTEVHYTGCCKQGV